MTEKPSPVLGEGGPRQWWVREFCEWKSEENEQFEVAPHPAFSHLLPEGEGKMKCQHQGQVAPVLRGPWFL